MKRVEYWMPELVRLWLTSPEEAALMALRLNRAWLGLCFESFEQALGLGKASFDRWQGKS